MLGLKLNHVSKRGPRAVSQPVLKFQRSNNTNWTHWSRVTHICVNELPYLVLILTWYLYGTKPSSNPALAYHQLGHMENISVKVYLKFRNQNVKISPAKWLPFCLSLNVWYRGLRYQIAIAHNASVPYPAMHHFVREIITCVHISARKWCIVGYLFGTKWNSWDGSIWVEVAFTNNHCFCTHRK